LKVNIFFCKKIRFSKKPLIILGSEFGLRVDSKILQNLIKFLIKKSFLNLKNLVGLNIVHQNLSQIHTCDLGLERPAQNYLNFLLKDKNFINKVIYKYTFFKNTSMFTQLFHYSMRQHFLLLLNNVDYLKNKFL